MNDIQKAMAFLREERKERVESAAPLSVVPKPAADASASGIEQASSPGTDVRPDEPRRGTSIGDAVSGRASSLAAGGRPDEPRRETGIDDAVSAPTIAPLTDRRDGTVVWQVAAEDLDAVNEVREAARGSESSSHPPRPRFDDAMFEDDVLDGIGSCRAALDTSKPAIIESTSTGDVGVIADVPEPARARVVPADPVGADRVVALPLRDLAARGFLTPDAPKGRLSEEFRRVKRPILRSIADAAETDAHRNVVMITSSVAGEGKTYTAINLAMSLAAERKRTVLLVDADVLKGSAGAVLGIDGDRPGLIDVLDDEHLDIADVMLATDVPNLRVVPAGRRDEHTTELLSSPRMSDLIDELARRYGDRIIVLDCPPMLQTNEANVIADHAGQVVFVVAGEETDQRLVLEAMNRFDEDKSVGVLLNKASGNSAAYGYDYGYG